MIDEILVILKNRLNSYFKLITASPDDKVTFPDSSKTDGAIFTLNNVVLTLVNLEEEKIIRQASFQDNSIRNGLRTEPAPVIGLNLYVLVVSRFSDYSQTLKFLSLIISFFQKLPILTAANTPELPTEIERLKIELITQPQVRQNEIWSGLRTAYQPSVLYKIGVVLFNDTVATQVGTSVQSTGIKTHKL